MKDGAPGIATLNRSPIPEDLAVRRDAEPGALRKGIVS